MVHTIKEYSQQISEIEEIEGGSDCIKHSNNIQVSHDGGGDLGDRTISLREHSKNQKPANLGTLSKQGDGGLECSIKELLKSVLNAK